jgi:carbamoyl-phosphate synthase large subunit
MPQEIFNILMTGAGAPGAAGILHCLSLEQRFHITMTDANPEATGRWLHPDFEVIPPAGADDFIKSLKEICRKKNIHLVLPLVTRELSKLALHKKEFEEMGVRVLVSDPEPLSIANNKSRLYQFLEWRGIPVPAFRVVENITQFQEALVALEHTNRQVCFKPSEANGSRGFRVLAHEGDEQQRLFDEKPSPVFISYAEANRILSEKPFPELLVSEYLPGEEYSVDCIAHHGETKLVVPRLRKKIINGISVQGEFVQEPGIISYCKDIIRALKLHGNIGVQVKASSTGNFLLLEINPRVQGTIAAGLGAGVNLPVLAVKQELGLLIDKEEWSVKWGTKFSRYWQEVFY